jgi:hypothetical protein
LLAKTFPVRAGRLQQRPRPAGRRCDVHARRRVGPRRRLPSLARFALAQAGRPTPSRRAS